MQWKGKFILMISKVIIPDLGATGGDVILEEWLVEPGEVIKTGQALYVVATDKATVEVEAFRDGVLHTILVHGGETASLGSVIALIADSIDEQFNETEDEIVNEAAPSPPSIPPLATHTSGERILASPLARRMAAEENISLVSIPGSGSMGQILKRDVLAVLNTMETPEVPPGVQQIPLSPMRRSIAERTSSSKSQIPHFYTQTTIDMQAAITLHYQAIEFAERSRLSKPTITDLCIRSVGLILAEFPDLNARFDGETISLYPEINIGLVVGLNEGIMIPVIRAANQLDLFSLAAATHGARNRAEAGQLISSDLGDSTFTISNLGMFDIDSFTAVINPPEVGILALGKIQEQPAVINGTIDARLQMIATLSVDHRVIDGILAARFLTALKELLENPFRLAFDVPQDTHQ
jgi:pyruvate dehydrogenase E2 component (dihydrolipoamide acetyltransferase)